MRHLHHLHFATAIPWARDAAIGVCVVWAISRVATAIHEHTERTEKTNAELIKEIRNLQNDNWGKVAFLRGMIARERHIMTSDPVNPYC